MFYSRKGVCYNFKYVYEVGDIINKEKELRLNELIDEIVNNKNDINNEKEFLAYMKYLGMRAYENDLVNRKVKVIAGIDEAGRGPLAGPVVAASVILPNDYFLSGLNDSKKLSRKKREYFYDEIIKNAISYGVGVVSVNDIDKYNIYNSTKIAMIKSILGLSVKPKHLLIDAMKIELNIPQTSIIKGDAKSVSIAAASIIAKVTRDRYMKELAINYPQYNFGKNAGYGTKEHIDAIRTYGITPEHRKSFEPIKSILKKENNLFNI